MTNEINKATREAMIETFYTKCRRMEKLITKHRPIVAADQARIAQAADNEVYVEFGFRIRDMFV